MPKIYIPIKRFHWTIHNLFAHPISEILYQFGFEKLSNGVHDITSPPEVSK